MFLTYLRRELNRRRKAALVIAMGLALGIGLVITVNSVSSGMGDAQDQVLKSLYGLGTDMTVTKAAPADSSSTRPQFNFDANSDGSTQSSDQVMVQGFQTLADTTVTSVSKQANVADAVGERDLVGARAGEEAAGAQLREQRPPPRPWVGHVMQHPACMHDVECGEARGRPPV